jgi:hypothetical protein
MSWRIHAEDRWEYPLLEGALEEAGLFPFRGGGAWQLMSTIDPSISSVWNPLGSLRLSGALWAFADQLRP